MNGATPANCARDTAHRNILCTVLRVNGEDRFYVLGGKNGNAGARICQNGFEYVNLGTSLVGYTAYQGNDIDDSLSANGVTIYADNDNVHLLAFNGDGSSRFTCLGNCSNAQDHSAFASFNIQGATLGPEPTCPPPPEEPPTVIEIMRAKQAGNEYLWGLENVRGGGQDPSVGTEITLSVANLNGKKRFST